MHTIQMYPAANETGVVYVVGFAYNVKDFSPLLACDTLGRAVVLVSYLNGGQPPADYTPWTNVMQAPDSPKVTPKVGDFDRGSWVMPKAKQ